MKKNPSKILKDTVVTLIYAIIAATIIRLFVFETMMVPTGSMIPTINIGDRLFIEKITFQSREPEIGEITVFWTPFRDERAQRMLRAFDKFMDLFSPKEFKGHVKYVKRLVAKDGDVITLKKVNGKWKLFVNGKIPENLKNVDYLPEGVFEYPDLWEYLDKASRLRNNEEEYKKFLFNLALKKGVKFSNIILSIVGGMDPVKYGIPYYEYVDKYLKPKNINFNDYIRSEGGQIYVKIPKGFYFFMGDNSKESLDSRYFGFVPKEAVIGRPILRIWPLKNFGPIQPINNK
ncbi:signal peptidase I [Thermosipho melanesiensis]|uniref:Signal peptidase I n=2 Tax=Thermosipho melanesiensis TaxID=46541 RepID=A6LNY3_THEM4|nr:signal peptidase I [Thermosipho melanesiensis]ABR31634.1 signal peptidase I [Thermosipho melanesiensis BI429]APT74663.1 signal peptidase I [Thermosipho melanesiensis]OOC35162.1 signal peptidase I [Thermosipho melanesiensis]OOC35372.1 signal peptidase I [Thermosipho melanesiensis]OOC36623.1 signal peptidase I [Thermosipho melanesiensis]